ncbi:MAG: ankyrin repeat domain-containing protein [Rhodosalinus sp.]
MATLKRVAIAFAFTLFALPAVPNQPRAEDADCRDLLTPGFYRDASAKDVESRLDGCDVMARDDRGWTPLHHAAAASDDPSVLRLLLARGADIEATTLDDPETRRVIEHLKPLHVAAAHSTAPGILTVLINRGADVDAQLPSDTCSRPMWECATASVHIAARRADGLEILETLLGAGADVDLRDEDGNRPLHLAARSGSHEMVALLLVAGASPGVERFDGATALHQAMLNPEVTRETAELLVESGIDPDEEADAGWRVRGAGATALIYCTQKCTSEEVVGYLIEVTEAKCLVDRHGRSALSEWEKNEALPKNDAYWALHEACSG